MFQRGHFTQPNHDSLLLSGCRPTVQVHTSQTPPPLPPTVLSSLCLLPCYILPCITHWHSGNILKRGIVAAPCYCQESDLSWGHIPTILIEGHAHVCVCVCLFHLFPITLGFLIFLFCHCLFFFTSSLFPLPFFISPHFHYLWCYPTTSSVLSRSLSTIEPYIMSFTYLWTCQVEEYFYQVCPNWNGLALKFYTDINSPRGWMLISFTSWCWVKFVHHFWLRGSILHIYWVLFCFLVIL